MYIIKGILGIRQILRENHDQRNIVLKLNRLKN